MHIVCRETSPNHFFKMKQTLITTLVMHVAFVACKPPSTVVQGQVNPIPLIVESLSQVEKFKLIFISDFKGQFQENLTQDLMNSGYSAVKFISVKGDTQEDQKMLIPQDCFDTSPLSQDEKLASMIAIYVNLQNLNATLDMISSSAVQCPLITRLGLFERSNLFMFFVDDDIDLANAYIFGLNKFQRHKHVVTVNLKGNLKTGHELFAWNLYQSHVVKLPTWRIDRTYNLVSDIFPDSPMEGFSLKGKSQFYSFSQWNPIPEMILSLARVGNFKVLFISDFQGGLSNDLFQALEEDHFSTIEIINVKIDASSERLSSGNCSDHTNQFSTDNFASLIVVHVNLKNLNQTLRMLSDTARQCDLINKMGLFDRNNIFAFFIDNYVHLASEQIFSYRRFQYHRNVLAVNVNYKDALNNNEYSMYAWNLYQSKVVKLPGWRLGKQFESLSDLFPDFPMEGYFLRGVALPYAHMAVGDVNVQPSDPEHLYDFVSGFEVEAMKAISKVLNFTFELTNPADGEWGRISEDQKWTGMVGCVASGRCDFGLSAIIMTEKRSKVIIATSAYAREGLKFAAPKPEASFNIWTLVHPLDKTVWLFTILSSFAILAFLVFLGRFAKVKCHVKLHNNWCDPLEASWYVFGSLLGESKARETNIESRKSLALRITMAAWIIACFIISTSYGGNLRAILLKPALGKQIDSLDDVVESGLPWDMILYGEEVEEYLATTDKPVLKAIWNGKTVAEYNPKGAFERLLKVSGGKQVSLEWKYELELQRELRFSRPNGDTFYYISDFIDQGHVGIAMHPFSPWYERINQVVVRIIEHGLMTRWRRKSIDYLKKREADSIANLRKEHTELFEETPTVREMRLSDFYGPFWFITLGCILAILWFLGEIRCNSWTLKKA